MQRKDLRSVAGQNTRCKACKLGTGPTGLRGQRCYRAPHEWPSGILVYRIRARRRTPAGWRICRGGTLVDGRGRVRGRLACACGDRQGNGLGRPSAVARRRRTPRFQRRRSTPCQYARRMQVRVRTHARHGRQPVGDAESCSTRRRHWRSGGADLRPATLRCPATAELRTHLLAF